MMALLVSGAAAAQERMPPIPPDKMTDAQQKVVTDVVSGPRGRLSPPFVPILRSPELLSRLQRVGEYLIYHNSLDPRIFELVVMMMARNWTQQFEWRHHYPLALKAEMCIRDRLAACHAFGVKAFSVPELFPYGIYTIPEISTVGRTEEQLTQEGVPYEIGKANYREIARGQILGDTSGLLKLVFHMDSRKLLGVHIIGEGASELVHIGQAVMAHHGSIDYFVNTVFNYPTLAECYKTAAFDGINRLG